MDFVVQAFVKADARVAIAAAAVLVIACLALGFLRVARSIWNEHNARFGRIQRRLEKDATALVDRLLRRDS